jgi:hypothetical protein
VAAGSEEIHSELGIAMGDIEKLTMQRKDLLILAIVCIERLGGKISITDAEEMTIDDMVLTTTRDYTNRSTVFTVTKLHEH